MSGHTPWRALRDRLIPPPPSDATWAKLHTIATLAGHRPSEVADAFGGYFCACRQSSWSHLDVFGPYGGCASGWHDAREFLRRYGVRDGVE